MRSLTQGGLTGRPARVSPGRDSHGQRSILNIPQTDSEITLAMIGGGVAVHEATVEWHVPELAQDEQGRWDALALEIAIAKAWGGGGSSR